jgi:hypothetical protein
VHHVLQLAVADDHVDRLGLEKIEGLAVAPVPLGLYAQDYRIKHMMGVDYKMRHISCIGIWLGLP